MSEKTKEVFVLTWAREGQFEDRVVRNVRWVSMGINHGFDHGIASSILKKWSRTGDDNPSAHDKIGWETIRKRSLKHWNCHVWALWGLSAKKTVLTDYDVECYLFAVCEVVAEAGGARDGSRISITCILHLQCWQMPISQPFSSHICW